MSTFPKKAGLVLIDADTARVLRVISLRFNADPLTRKLRPQFALLESLVHPTLPEIRAGEHPTASFVGGSLRLHFLGG